MVIPGRSQLFAPSPLGVRASPFFLIDKNTGTQIPVSLSQQDLMRAGRPNATDLSQVSHHPHVVDRMMAACDRVNPVLQKIRARPPVAGTFREMLAGLDPQTLSNNISANPPFFRFHLQQDDLFQDGGLLRKLLFSNIAQFSPSSAVTFADAVFPLFDELKFRASWMYKSAVEYISKIKTVWVVGAQEFISFTVLTPVIMGLIDSVLHRSGSPPTLLQTALYTLFTFTATPLVVQGIEDCFKDGEKWQQYFVMKDGELVKDKQGREIPDLKKWKNKLNIIGHSFIYGGLVRSAKVTAVLFPEPVSALDNERLRLFSQKLAELLPQKVTQISQKLSGLMPKTGGEWIAFLLELLTDVFLYMVYFGINSLNKSAEAGQDWTLAFIVSTISTLMYCVTAPELGRKYGKVKAVWLRQLFSVIKNPAVMICGAGILGDGVLSYGASILGIIAVHSALLVWAYKLKGDPEITQYTKQDTQQKALAEIMPAVA